MVFGLRLRAACPLTVTRRRRTSGAGNLKAKPSLQAPSPGRLRQRPPDPVNPGEGAYLPGLRIGPPKSSEGRTAAPHSSHSTRNADGNRAPQAGHRCRTSPAQLGHAFGISASSSTKYRSVKPQSTQNATQSPSVLRRSSWIQFRFGRFRASIRGSVAWMPSRDVRSQGAEGAPEPGWRGPEAPGLAWRRNTKALARGTSGLRTGR